MSCGGGGEPSDDSKSLAALDLRLFNLAEVGTRCSSMRLRVYDACMRVACETVLGKHDGQLSLHFQL